MRSFALRVAFLLVAVPLSLSEQQVRAEPPLAGMYDYLPSPWPLPPPIPPEPAPPPPWWGWPPVTPWYQQTPVTVAGISNVPSFTWPWQGISPMDPQTHATPTNQAVNCLHLAIANTIARNEPSLMITSLTGPFGDRYAGAALHSRQTWTDNDDVMHQIPVSTWNSLLNGQPADPGGAGPAWPGLRSDAILPGGPTANEMNLGPAIAGMNTHWFGGQERLRLGGGPVVSPNGTTALSDAMTNVLQGMGDRRTPIVLINWNRPGTTETGRDGHFVVATGLYDDNGAITPGEHHRYLFVNDPNDLSSMALRSPVDLPGVPIFWPSEQGAGTSQWTITKDEHGIYHIPDYKVVNPADHTQSISVDATIVSIYWIEVQIPTPGTGVVLGAAILAAFGSRRRRA